MNNNLNIDYVALSDKLNVIEEDIDEIEEILKQVDRATTSLNDEKIWKSTEKTKMDQDYIPYVKNISIRVPIALKKHLNHLRNVINIYENTEANLIKEIDNHLEDLKTGE